VALIVADGEAAGAVRRTRYGEVEEVAPGLVGG